MNIGQLRQQFPMKIHADSFLKLHDSITVVSDCIADTMAPILTSARWRVWGAVNAGIEWPVKNCGFVKKGGRSLNLTAYRFVPKKVL